MKDKLGRREFLKRATQAAAVAAVSTGAACGAMPEKKRSMPTMRFQPACSERPGETADPGLRRRRAAQGLGQSAFAEDRVKLVRYAYDRGVRYFDTAGNYMESQAILGEALKGVRRQVFLAHKVEDDQAGKIRESRWKESSRNCRPIIWTHPDPRHAGTGADERRAGDEDPRRVGQAPRRDSHPISSGSPRTATSTRRWP